MGTCVAPRFDRGRHPHNVIHTYKETIMGEREDQQKKEREDRERREREQREHTRQAQPNDPQRKGGQPNDPNRMGGQPNDDDEGMSRENR